MDTFYNSHHVQQLLHAYGQWVKGTNGQQMTLITKLHIADEQLRLWSMGSIAPSDTGYLKNECIIQMIRFAI
jgi:hypothetical protein